MDVDEMAAVGLGGNLTRSRAGAVVLLLFPLACRTNPVVVGVVERDAGSNGGTEVRQSVTMALVPKAGNNPVFNLANEGAGVAARDLSKDSAYDITVSFQPPGQLTQEEQVQAAIDTGKKGLIVSCVNNDTGTLLDQAVRQGVQVLTFDSDCPGSDRFTYYSIDNEKAGATAAELLAKVMGEGPRTVAILTGREGADNLENRVKGFKDALQRIRPEVEVVGENDEKVYRCEETAESCRAAIEDNGLLDRHANLDGLFITGLWGVQAACACDTAGENCSRCGDKTLMPKWKAAADEGLKTVSFDTLPFQLMLVQEGYLSALISQKYFGWGYETVNLMFSQLTDKKFVVPDFVDSGFDVICRSNWKEMLAKWQEKDFGVFRTPVPECTDPR
jgi:ribose transport system substrate-binding protein